MKLTVLIWLCLLQWSSVSAQEPTLDWIWREETERVRFDVSDAGEVYVGRSTRVGDSVHIIVTKLNKSGVRLWDADHAEFIGGGPLYLTNVVVDGNGSCYVMHSDGFGFFLIVKFLDDGSVAWSHLLDRNGDYWTREAMLDPAGNLLVHGNGSTGSSGWYDIMKYSPDGELELDETACTAPYDCGSSGADLSSWGDLYVTTRGWYGTYLSSIVSIDTSSGERRWKIEWESSWSWDVVAGLTENVYVIGDSIGVGVIMKTNRDGLLRWTVPHDVDSCNAIPFALAIDGDENLHTLSRSCDVPPRLILARFDSSGATHWSASAYRPFESYLPPGLLMDRKRYIIVAGATDVGAGRQLYAMKYNLEGHLLWELDYDDGGGSTGQLVEARTDTNGYLYLSAIMEHNDTISTIIFRVSDMYVPVSDESSELPDEVSLLQNYPNPFNPTTTFSFSIAQSSIVNLTVFDLLGREVATIVNEKLSPGAYTREWDARGLASGVYVYRLSAGEFVQTRKVVLIR